MKMRASRNFFCVAVVALLASCARETSSEQQVRDLISRGEVLAEERDVSGVMALVSKDYADARSFDKTQLTNYLRVYFAMHPSVNLLVRIDSLEFPADNLAQAQITIGMLGTRGESEEDWEFAADLETLEVELLDEDGEWRVIRADRKRSP
jgi:hypothetical protein